MGDFASLDERVQLASQRVGRLLRDAGVSSGLLRLIEATGAVFVERRGPSR